MAPVLFRIGSIPINSYGLLLVIGFAVGVLPGAGATIVGTVPA